MNPETRQAIFNYFSEQHDVLLLESDLDEVQNIILKDVKQYCKHWIDQAAEVAMLQGEKGLPVGDAVYALKDEIDKH